MDRLRRGWARLRNYLTKARVKVIARRLAEGVLVVACAEVLFALVPMHSTITVIATVGVLLMLYLLIWGSPNKSPNPALAEMSDALDRAILAHGEEPPS